MQTDNTCGVSGEDGSNVSVRQINQMINRISQNHLIPAKQALFAVEEKLDAHIQEQDIVLAKITGGITTLKYIGYAFVTVLTITGLPNLRAILKAFTS